MRFEYLQHHLSRRQMLGGMAKAGAAGVVASTAGGVLLSGTAGASSNGSGNGTKGNGNGDGGGERHDGEYDDSFSIEGALSGEWAAETSERYGEDDQRGTLNEITPEKTARALSLLAGASAVRTYGLGQLMRDPTAAYVNFPPRIYSQRIFVLGFQPTEGDWYTAPTNDQAGWDAWRNEDLARGPLGYLSSPEPLGANLVSSCEERFLHGGTYQIGTQFDHFPHFGVGDILYNGWRAPDIARPKGFTELGMEVVGPFVTRGVLIDVLGWKISQGSGDVQTVDGHEMLTDNYRITVDDLRATMEWEGIDCIEPGDAVLIRTGWWWLGENPELHDRFLAMEPGIYIAEAKFLGDHRPALVGADTWAVEVLGDPDLTEWAFPCHTEFLVKRGVHIGESVITHELAEAGAYEFVYTYSPQNAQGATAGNAPPVALVPER